MTQMFFHLVTFTLPSSQVEGHSCDMFSHGKEITNLRADKLWYKEAGQRKVHSKLQGALYTGCVCLWKEGLGTGRLSEGEETRKEPYSLLKVLGFLGSHQWGLSPSFSSTTTHRYPPPASHIDAAGPSKVPVSIPMGFGICHFSV